MKTLRKRILATILAICCCSALNAQISLVGRSYENPNILSGELDRIMKETELKIDSIRAASVAKQEKEKGRKLTAKELAEVNEQIQTAQSMMMAMKKGMKISIGVDFTTSKDAIFKTKIKIDESALKVSGIGWLKRKALKTAIGMMPDKKKGTYEIKGNLIIISDKKERDTLTISDDGKYVYGMFDKDTKFKLSRTK